MRLTLLASLLATISILSLIEILPKSMYGVSLILILIIIAIIIHMKSSQHASQRSILMFLTLYMMIVSLSEGFSYDFSPVYPKSGDWAYYYMASVLFLNKDLPLSLYDSHVHHAIGWHLLVCIISVVLDISISVAYHIMMPIMYLFLLLTFILLAKRFNVKLRNLYLALLFTLSSVPVVFDMTQPVPRSLAVALAIAMTYAHLIMRAPLISLIIATTSTAIHNGVGLFSSLVLVGVSFIYGIIKYENDNYRFISSSLLFFASSIITIYMGAIDGMVRYALGYDWNIIAHILKVLNTGAVSDVGIPLDPVVRPSEETLLRILYILNFGSYLALPFVGFFLYLKVRRHSPVPLTYILFNYVMLLIGVMTYVAMGFLSSLRAISLASPIVLISAIHALESLKTFKNISSKLLWIPVITLILLSSLGGSLTLGQSGYQALYLLHERSVYQYLGYPRYLPYEQLDLLSKIISTLKDSNVELCSDSISTFLINKNDINFTKYIYENYRIVWFEPLRRDIGGCQIVIIMQDLIPLRGTFNFIWRTSYANPAEIYAQTLAYITKSIRAVVYADSSKIVILMLG
jgi:hypothetical protein